MTRTAVITGGGSGIGRASAVRLAADGLQVAVWDLNEASAQAVAAEITAGGGQAIAARVDVSRRADIDAALAAVHARFGPVTVIVTSAGITGFDEFMSITEEHWDRMMAVNLKGTFLCIQAVIPDMLAAQWGRVVNISSSSTQSGAKHMTHYVASKGGVVGLTRALAVEFAASGITVNHVPPGFVDTPMQQKVIADGLMNLAERESVMPMRRQGRPEEQAAAVAFLASEDAGYITGHTLSCNGGRYLV